MRGKERQRNDEPVSSKFTYFGSQVSTMRKMFKNVEYKTVHRVRIYELQCNQCHELYIEQTERN